MSKKLENRVAVITGATSGMALATAKLTPSRKAHTSFSPRGAKKDSTNQVKEVGAVRHGVQGDAGSLAGRSIGCSP